jgi:two-component system, NarL family, nitrate/nitrite response regulator NarL
MTLQALIVDDNVEFLTTARRLLEREGIAVAAVATTGAEALRQAKEHKPDVILVDVDLGDESGFDLADRLTRASEGRLPVVLISAYPEEDLVDLVDTSAAIGFVSKPRLSATAIIELFDDAHRGDGMRPS